MRKIKKYNKPMEEESIYCDKCGKEYEIYEGYVCSVCERDLCKECFPDKESLLDGMVIPCPFCRPLAKGFVVRMKDMWGRAERYQKQYFDLHKEWGKASRKIKRKKLSETQREIVIGRDKCGKCKELLEWSRVYPFDVFCPICHMGVQYEDQILFGKEMKDESK